MNIAFITHTASHLFCIMVRSMVQCFSLYHETWSPLSLLQFVPLRFTGSYGTCCVYVLGVPFSYVSFNCFFLLLCIYKLYIYREDITWLRRDMIFLFGCWKIFQEWAQRTSEIFLSTQEEKFRISKLPCNILFIIQTPVKYQTILLKRFFGVKGAVYYEAIAMVIFSHVKITCYFHMWRYQVFGRKLTWYFIGVYIIKMFSPSFLPI